ncbi:gamma-glutamylcyclotransferase [Holdemanella biformis]|uniref:gamma-glutamylcyclotransferase n=1 Tax=Holdemanella biformis TaxID=1735 RepID=UPI001C27DF47|nr:gamma-glutamylcyclotransferase [Holdemanella biformis]MBV3416502.1 gamma-glutamylcyclotransferase [Holdemanella biformis]
MFIVNGLVYGTIRWIDDTLYVKDKNSIVEGEVYEVDEHTKQRVDVYEGEGYLFKCIDAEINLNNKPIKAKVYEYIVR